MSQLNVIRLLSEGPCEVPSLLCLSYPLYPSTSALSHVGHDLKFTAWLPSSSLAWYVFSRLKPKSDHVNTLLKAHQWVHVELEVEHCALLIQVPLVLAPVSLWASILSKVDSASKGDVGFWWAKPPLAMTRLVAYNRCLIRAYWMTTSVWSGEH